MSIVCLGWELWMWIYSSCPFLQPVFMCWFFKHLPATHPLPLFLSNDKLKYYKSFFSFNLLTCTDAKLLLSNPLMDQSYTEPWITLRDSNIADTYLFMPIERYSTDCVKMVLNEGSCKLAGAPGKRCQGDFGWNKAGCRLLLSIQSILGQFKTQAEGSFVTLQKWVEMQN